MIVKKPAPQVSSTPKSFSSSSQKKDSRTIRSRSFKAMRHLINVVNLTHIESEESTKKHVKREEPSNTTRRNVSKTTSNATRPFLIPTEEKLLVPPNR
ncbi:hypothetical protein PCANC_01842 [Puccinia coronata f. sp. avenae]|nr:hypothetical protein PCANC_01842 [Puccinia coronata f. sp. avenae]